LAEVVVRGAGHDAAQCVGVERTLDGTARGFGGQPEQQDHRVDDHDGGELCGSH